MRLCLLVAAICFGCTDSLLALDPANPNVTASARQVFGYIRSLQASGFIISGQQVGYTPFVVTDLSRKPSGESEITRVEELTGGKLPALVGFDWDTCYTSAERRASIIQLAKSQWAAGGLVTFSWHEANPRQQSPDAAYGTPNNALSQLTSAEWNDLLNVPASTIHQNWLFHVDTVAGWLKQLRDAGVVVLWRPYHEVDGAGGVGGGWFWWNSNDMYAESRYRALWQMLYERMVNFHGLNNLLWVYAPVRAYYSFYPIGYVDFAGHDYYSADPDDINYWTRFLQVGSMVEGRSVALTECGRLPSASVLKDARYAWVMVWLGDYLDKVYYGNTGRSDGNSGAEVAAFYTNPRVVDRANFRTAFNAPAVIIGKRRVKVSRRSYTVRGSATGMNVARVEAKLSGKKKPLVAKGTGKWALKLKLTKPRSVLRISATDTLGRVSAPVRVVVIRRLPASTSGT